MTLKIKICLIDKEKFALVILYFIFALPMSDAKPINFNEL